MVGSSVTARAHANIALVKYWGKRAEASGAASAGAASAGAASASAASAGAASTGTAFTAAVAGVHALNLPAAGSLSLTLAALSTTTTVRFDRTLKVDLLTFDGVPSHGVELRRISAWLDLIRARAGLTLRAEIETQNDFPTASGLASSASGFAALAVAAAGAAGLDLPARELSILARRGSGSAARSIYGGFVRMHAGDRPDGEDAYAAPIEVAAMAARARMVVAIVGGGAPKLHGSRDAMEHCAATSPLYAGWLSVVPRDLASAEAALFAGDLATLGEIAEANALAMHAAAIASRPAILYWQPATLAVLAAVRALRDDGRLAWATMDAGPHVKVLTDGDDAAAVADALRLVPGVTDVIISGSGGPAHVIAEET